jgi:hypothetical protein
MVQNKSDKRGRTGAQMTAALEYTDIDHAVLDILDRDNHELVPAVAEHYGEMLSPVGEFG